MYPTQQNSPSLSIEVTIPSSRAVEAVTNLKVEPGSYVSEIALFLHICCNALDLSVADIELQFALISSLFMVYGSFKL